MFCEETATKIFYNPQKTFSKIKKNFCRTFDIQGMLIKHKHKSSQCQMKTEKNKKFRTGKHTCMHDVKSNKTVGILISSIVKSVGDVMIYNSLPYFWCMHTCVRM